MYSHIRLPIQDNLPRPQASLVIRLPHSGNNFASRRFSVSTFDFTALLFVRVEAFL